MCDKCVCEKYNLPALIVKEVFVESQPAAGQLFAAMAAGLSERRGARRESIDKRVLAAAEIANASEEQFVVWCNLNDEGDALADAINGAVQVSGSGQSDEEKEKRLVGFAKKEFRVIVSKAKIAGWGLNWQNCHNVIYFPDDSFEAYFQAIRRCWRFGQPFPVTVYMILSESERSILENLKRKEKEAMRMYAELVGHMAEISKANIKASAGRTKLEYHPKKEMKLPAWL